MEEFQAQSGWVDPGRFRKMQLNQKSTDPDLSQKKCQRETAGGNKQISTYRAFFFAGELDSTNRQDGTSGDQYELDQKIISEGMFHYYHAFPIANEAKEGTF